MKKLREAAAGGAFYPSNSDIFKSSLQMGLLALARKNKVQVKAVDYGVRIISQQRTES
jgi:hypothetical protein